ncbi:hypothetical protein HDE_05713 [Halotydeus destructor]|nr:hypothetical protein HDE_05713 [Halotydeus destructor]
MAPLMQVSFLLIVCLHVVHMSPYCSIGINDACNKDESCCTGYCDKTLHWMAGFGRCCQFPGGYWGDYNDPNWYKWRKENDKRIERNCTCFPTRSNREHHYCNSESYYMEYEKRLWLRPSTDPDPRDGVKSHRN